VGERFVEKIMWKRALLLVILLAATGWADSRVKIGEITWFTDYDEAMAYAREQNKPLWLHFGEDPG
jgi:hypothetical protein